MGYPVRMKRRPDAPVVYSTARGAVCPRCGWPRARCQCSSVAEEPVPERPTAVLRIERKGRRGKTVTVIGGLPRNRAFVDDLARVLKRACGAGGTTGDDHVEIQGDHRETLRSVLRDRGFTVKG